LACPRVSRALTGQVVAGAMTSSTSAADSMLSSADASAARMMTLAAGSAVASNMVDHSTMAVDTVLRVEATSEGAANAAKYGILNAVSGNAVSVAVNINVAEVGAVAASSMTNSALTSVAMLSSEIANTAETNAVAHAAALLQQPRYACQ
jgi:hypothetical protein